MRTRFHEGLDELKDKLLRMGGLAERSVEQAIAAYHKHDRKACDDVFETEHAINLAEREIEGGLGVREHGGLASKGGHALR